MTATLLQQTNPAFFNVKDYGAQGDGATDDTAALSAARAAARFAGGGTVFYPAGTYISGNQDISLDAKIQHLGAGIDASIVKLKNGANTDLFSAQTASINLAQTFGTGILGTLSSYGFSEMTLDGNKANQTSGPSYPLRVYGYSPRFHNLVVKNGYSGGILSDWNGSNILSNAYEAQITNLYVRDSNGIGVQWSGPSESQFSNLFINACGSHCLHLCPNALSTRIVNSHLYGPGATGVVILCEAGKVAFDNVSAEGANTVNVALLAAGILYKGVTFGEGVGISTVSGIQIGQQAGQTPYTGQLLQAAGVTTAIAPFLLLIDASITSCQGPNGAIWFAFDGGNNIVHLTISQSAGVYTTGFISPSSVTEIVGSGLTPDGSQGKGSFFYLPVNTFYSTIYSSTLGKDLMRFNGVSNPPDIRVPNSITIYGYSDNGSTHTWTINGDGSIKLQNAGTMFSGSGVPSAGTGANGDYYFRTDTPAVANQRIYVKAVGVWVGIV